MPSGSVGGGRSAVAIAWRRAVQRAIPRRLRLARCGETFTQRIAKRIRPVAKSYLYRPRRLIGRGFAARRTIQIEGFFKSKAPMCGFGAADTERTEGRTQAARAAAKLKARSGSPRCPGARARRVQRPAPRRQLGRTPGRGSVPQLDVTDLSGPGRSRFESGSSPQLEQERHTACYHPW